MIVYLAHWDWILTQSRKDIVSNINDSKFMAICPIDKNKIELEKIGGSSPNKNKMRESSRASRRAAHPKSRAALLVERHSLRVEPHFSSSRTNHNEGPDKKL